MRKRRGYHNLAIALAQRELCEAPSASAGVRRFYENVVPNTAFGQVSAPPDVCFCRFTPCGKYLVAFNPNKGELLLYRFKGTQFSLPGDSSSALPATSQPTSTHVVRVKRSRSSSSDLQHWEHPHDQPLSSLQQTTASAEDRSNAARASHTHCPALAAPHAAQQAQQAQQQPAQSSQIQTPQHAQHTTQHPNTHTRQVGGLDGTVDRVGSSHMAAGGGGDGGVGSRPLHPPQASITGRGGGGANGAAMGEGPAGGSSRGPPQSPPSPLPRLEFRDMFEPYACLQITTCGDEQIATDFALAVHGRLLVVASSSPEGALGDGEEVVPLSEVTTLHLVDMAARRVVDRHVLAGDCVELSRHQGVHLLGDMLLVLGISTQTLYFLQVLPSGRLLPLHTLGALCRDDDALAIEQHRLAEQHAQQEREQERQAAAAAAAGVRAERGGDTPSWQLPSGAAGGRGAGGSPTDGGAGGGGEREGVRGGRGAFHGAQEVEGGGGQPGGAAAAGAGGAGRFGLRAVRIQGGTGRAGGAVPPVAAGLGGRRRAGDTPRGTPRGVAGTPPWGRGGEGEWDSDAEEWHLSPAAAATANGPIIQGLKQRLLAHLFKQAMAQQAAQQAQQPRWEAASRPPWPSSSGSRGGGAAGRLGDRGGSWGGGAWKPGTAPGDRRVLDRFYYHFEHFLELVMWKAQFLDRHRLLIQWVAPDLLMGPHRRPPHPPAPPHSHHHSAYLMVYNLSTTLVEKLMGANSQQIAEWYLAHAEAVQCGRPGSTWERHSQPAAASRVAREQFLRDKQQYIKDLRQRLMDDLPTPPQHQQPTPYLDRGLYLFDERFITPSLKGHHLPHRAVKFMCCSQPERLRFKLDPADITHNLRGGGRGSSRAHQVVYLFHPFQPFLLAVVQDMEAGQPEGVAAFSRLA